MGASLKNPRSDPNSKAEVLEWLALYYSNALGDLAAARAVINDAVLIQPDNWTFRLRRLEIMAAQQDWPAVRLELAQRRPVMTPWARVLDPTLAQRFDDLERKLGVENLVGPSAR